MPGLPCSLLPCTDAALTIGRASDDRHLSSGQGRASLVPIGPLARLTCGRSPLSRAMTGRCDGDKGSVKEVMVMEAKQWTVQNSPRTATTRAHVRC